MTKRLTHVLIRLYRKERRTFLKRVYLRSISCLLYVQFYQVTNYLNEEAEIKRILTPVIETNDVYGLIEDDDGYNLEEGFTIDTELQGAYERMERLEDAMLLEQIIKQKKRYPFRYYRITKKYDRRMEYRYFKAQKIFRKFKKILTPHTMFDA